MDPRIKHIAFLLPPVIIAGVWFDFIPIAPGIRTRINSLKEVNTSPKKTLPILTSVTGTVFFRERPALPEGTAKGNELLSDGSSLVTADGASALITFTDSDTWKLRLAAGSRVNFDKVSEDGTILNLVHGSAILSAKNNTGRVRPVSIRTNFASFTTSGALFAVTSETDKWTLLSVKEGIVIAENFKLMQKTQIHEGFNYLVKREGEARNQLELSAIELYNWDFSQPNPGLPAIEDVLKTFDERVAPVADEKEKLHQEKLVQVDEALKSFRTEHDGFRRELQILSDNARDSREGFVTERRRIERDIRCLQTSVSECNLYSEKILLLRGFPRTWGNPRYRSEIVVGLQKYLQEREDEVSIREDEARVLEELMKKRDAALSSAETNRTQEKDLDSIIPSLQDARLKR